MILVGFSLSFCIRDIIDGDVDKNDVRFIVTNTQFTSPGEFETVLKSYREVYWIHNPELGCQIAQDLWRHGKLIQPRLLNLQYPFPYGGHWAMLCDSGALKEQVAEYHRRMRSY